SHSARRIQTITGRHSGRLTSLKSVRPSFCGGGARPASPNAHCCAPCLRTLFVFNRRKALSTDSPFLSLISVNLLSLPLCDLLPPGYAGPSRSKSGGQGSFPVQACQRAKWGVQKCAEFLSLVWIQ